MRLTMREFHRLVGRALDDLPPDIQKVIDNVAILVEDVPAASTLADIGPDGDDHQGAEHLFGLYTGVPLTERQGGLPMLPDTIVLFRRPIESACSSREEVVREIRVTLLHEVGHYMGMNEDDLERLGYG